MSGWPRVPMRDLVVDERPQRSDTGSPVWNLNLDQIEPDTGRILKRIRVSPEELGPSTYPFAAGTVLYSKLRPYLNKVVVADEAGYATTELVPLHCNLERVLPSYLAYFLRSAEFLSFANTVVAGAKMPRMVMSEFWKFEVPLPPIAEQRRIATILDKADALRTKRREALAQLDRLAQSIFVEMFGDPATNAKGWPVSTLGDLLESATYGTSEKSGASGQFPVLRMNNITRTGEMDFSDLKYMDLEAAERDRYLVRAGDILFNRTNSADLVGKTAIFRQPEPMAYAGYLIRLRANADNDPEYLAGFMNTPYAKRVLRGMCKSIIGMANINATEVQGIRIARPPLALQTEYRERIRSLNHV